jgi:copper chaperone CopZ
MSVREAVEEIEGVSSVVVDLEKGTATVTFEDSVVEGDIVEAIEEEGFKVS